MVSDSATNFEDFIKKFMEKGLKENPLDVLVKILIKEEELPSLKRDFKEKYLKPLLKNWEVLVKDINKNSLKTSSIFKQLEDVINSKINDIKKSEPSKPEEKKQNSSSSALDVLKNVFSNKTSDNKKPENPIVQNEPENKPQQPEEKLLQKNKQENIISFSTETSNFLVKLTKSLIDGEKENLEKLNLKTTAQPTGGGIMGFLKDLITSLPALLAAIGGATVLAGMFWPEIKKFISEKFGDKAAEVFDKFQGTVNAIGKFLTMGGFKITMGKTFSSIGTFLGTLADDLLMTFKGIFLGLGDNAAGGILTKTAQALSKGGLKGILKTGAGILLKGISKVTLKAIPLIGSVISFADAYGRFKEGEYGQGLIDIGAGLAGFVPGIGTAISIGLSLMNAFIDFQGEEKKEELTKQTINVSSMLMKGVGMFAKIGSKLKFLPLIGTMFTLYSAWDNFNKGNILEGTLNVVSGLVSIIPGVGIPLSIGVDLLNSFLSTPENKENGVQRSGFSIATIATKALSYFAKFGKPFFKRLPLIGSLLSFGSAWDRFQQDNIVGGILDVVSGIVGLVPGIGTVASIGLDILNSFLDSKDEATGKPKSVAVGNFFKGIWEKFKTTGIFKTFSSLGEGLTKLVSGDVVGGMDALSKLPYIGGMFSPIASWLNEKPPSETTSQTNSGKPPLSDTSKEIIKNLPTEYKKEEEDKLFEEGKELLEKRKNIEKEIEELKNSTPKDRGGAASNIKRISELENQKKQLLEERDNLQYKTRRYKELKEGKKVTTLEDYENESKEIEGSQENANFYSNDPTLSQIAGLNNQNSSLNIEPRQDIKNSGNIIIDPKTGNVITLHANDSIFASKPGDSVDKTFKKLNENIDNLNKQIEHLVRVQSQIERNKNSNNTPTPSPVIVNNSTTQTTNQNTLKFSAERDEIFLTRMDWLRNNTYNR
jgi:hypothetical protein